MNYFTICQYCFEAYWANGGNKENVYKYEKIFYINDLYSHADCFL
jgi:hypothetical protein